MQRPRLNGRVVKALDYAKDHLSAIYADMGGDDYGPEMTEDMARAIKFLDDTIRFERARKRGAK